MKIVKINSLAKEILFLSIVGWSAYLFYAGNVHWAWFWLLVYILIEKTTYTDE